MAKIYINAPIFLEQFDQPGVYDIVDWAPVEMSLEQLENLTTEVVRLFEGGGDVESIRDVAQQIGLLEQK